MDAAQQWHILNDPQYKYTDGYTEWHDDLSRHMLTDYPFIELGDDLTKLTPTRECIVIGYDGNKYCLILIEEKYLTVKKGYLYNVH